MGLQKLPADVSHRLSSGQVVTSAFSIVKELLENALDAGATSIDVKLENYGLDRIQVIDNGSGIPQEDAEFVAQAQYTSKIRTVQDIDNLCTLGYRGEALSAVCACCSVTITTRTDSETVGRRLTLDSSGQVTAEQPAPHGRGTTVVASGLFADLPVRRRFHDTASRRRDQLKAVEGLLVATAVCRPQLRVALFHDKCVVIRKTACDSMKAAAVQLLNCPAARGLHSLSLVSQQVTMELLVPPAAAVALPSARSTPDCCYLSINGRAVRHRSIEKVIQQEYSDHHQLSPAKYPLCVINVRVPADAVDPNLEPNKTKLYLRNDDEVTELLRNGLRRFYKPESATTDHVSCVNIRQSTAVGVGGATAAGVDGSAAAGAGAAEAARVGSAGNHVGGVEEPGRFESGRQDRFYTGDCSVSSVFGDNVAFSVHDDIEDSDVAPVDIARADVASPVLAPRMRTAKGVMLDGPRATAGNGPTDSAATAEDDLEMFPDDLDLTDLRPCAENEYRPSSASNAWALGKLMDSQGDLVQPTELFMGCSSAAQPVARSMNTGPPVDSGFPPDGGPMEYAGGANSWCSGRMEPAAEARTEVPTLRQTLLTGSGADATVERRGSTGRGSALSAASGDSCTPLKQMRLNVAAATHRTTGCMQNTGDGTVEGRVQNGGNGRVEGRVQNGGDGTVEERVQNGGDGGVEERVQNGGDGIVDEKMQNGADGGVAGRIRNGANSTRLLPTTGVSAALDGVDRSVDVSVSVDDPTSSPIQCTAAFALYCRDMRRKYTISDPAMDLSALTRLLADGWRMVSEEERRRYQQLARQGLLKRLEHAAASTPVSTARPTVEPAAKRPRMLPRPASGNTDLASPAPTVGSTGSTSSRPPVHVMSTSLQDIALLVDQLKRSTAARDPSPEIGACRIIGALPSATSCRGPSTAAAGGDLWAVLKEGRVRVVSGPRLCEHATYRRLMRSHRLQCRHLDPAVDITETSGDVSAAELSALSALSRDGSAQLLDDRLAACGYQLDAPTPDRLRVRAVPQQLSADSWRVDLGQLLRRMAEGPGELHECRPTHVASCIQSEAVRISRGDGALMTSQEISDLVDEVRELDGCCSHGRVLSVGVYTLPDTGSGRAVIH